MHLLHIIYVYSWHNTNASSVENEKCPLQQIQNIAYLHIHRTAFAGQLINIHKQTNKKIINKKWKAKKKHHTKTQIILVVRVVNICSLFT